MNTYIARPAAALVAAAFLLSIQPAPADGAERIGVCGEVKAYTPAGQAEGSVTLGTRTFVLRAGEQAGAQQNARNIARPNFICLEGLRDASGAFTEYLAWPPPFPFCGTVTAYESPSAGARGRIVIEARATYDLPVTVPLDVVVGGRACVRLALDQSTGDGVVDLRERRFEHIYAKVAGICGTVLQWTAAEPVAGRAMLVHREPGSITVGTRRYEIAAGTEYSLVNAPPRVGSTTCLAGSLDAKAVLVEYAAQPGMPGCTGGAVAEYRAPTASRDGLISLGGGLSLTPDSYRFAIPAGTTMPPDVTDGRYCFELGVDAAGDAIVTGARIPAPGGVTGPAPKPPIERPITSLPSTSAAKAQQATSLRVCGRVTRFEEASATQEGSLSIGSRSSRIAPNGRYLEMHSRMRVGDIRCIRAALDPDGRLTEFWAISADRQPYPGWPIPRLVDVGRVTEIVRATPTEAGRIVLDDGAASYPIAPATALRPQVLGHEIGIALQLRADGDAEVVGWSAGATMGGERGIAAYDGVCGRVAALKPATSSVSGGVTVADRTFQVAAGVYLGWGSATTWGQEPIVGRDMCMSGVRASDGTLLSYSMTDMFPMNVGVCGEVVDIDRDAWRIRLASDTVGMSGWHRIRRGTPLPSAFTGRTCFGRAVAPDGVAEITSVHGFVASSPAVPPPHTGIRSLPSTSTRGRQPMPSSDNETSAVLFMGRVTDPTQ